MNHKPSWLIKLEKEKCLKKETSVIRKMNQLLHTGLYAFCLQISSNWRRLAGFVGEKFWGSLGNS